MSRDLQRFPPQFQVGQEYIGTIVSAVYEQECDAYSLHVVFDAYPEFRRVLSLSTEAAQHLGIRVLGILDPIDYLNGACFAYARHADPGFRGAIVSISPVTRTTA